MSWNNRIQIALRKRQIAGEMRSRIVMERNVGRVLIYNRKQYYNFSSNDYLGLSYHPYVIKAWQDGAEYYGISSSSSGHISGYTTAHYQLEDELSNWLGYQRALLFISGFSANQAVITALAKKNDYIIADRLSHASLLEAASLSLAKLQRFRHNDVQNLSSLLRKACSEQILVVTEGIFSMDGDSAPLSSLYAATQREKGWLMVDDAHGFGIVGKEGQGSCAKQEIKPEILVITFGKSVGVSGAAVLCSKDVADYLLQYARHLIYSTSMPPAQAMAILASLNIIRSAEGEEKRQKLLQNIQQFRNGIISLRMCLPESNSAIQPLIVGENLYTLMLVEYLKKRDIWTVAIRPPTVPKGTARLRITLSATHKTEDILVLLEALYDSNK